MSDTSDLDEGIDFRGFVRNLKDKLPGFMARPLHDDDPEIVLEAEQDIRNKLDGRDLDFESLIAISSIYRAANAVRNRMERDVLTPVGLSWGGFTILFVLWVWGDRDTGQLAVDCGVAKGTLSGMIATLEKAEMVSRSRHPRDGRMVMVHLEPAGRRTIETVFPDFNAHESKLTGNLNDGERRELARLLRIVTSTADEVIPPPE